MAVPLSEPNLYREVWRNQFQTKDTRQKPFALRWWQPDCTYGDDGDCETCYSGCHENEPPLVNDFAQPLDADGYEKFAFRLHSDGSLEFKGHLDISAAASGDVAFTLPGAVLEEDDFLLPHDQYFHTTVIDTGSNTFSLALVFIAADTGDVTLTWPAT